MNKRENLGDKQTFMQTQKEPTWLFLLFVQQTQDSSLAWIILIRIHGKCMYNTSDRDSFHGQGHCDIVAFPANIFRQYLKRYLKMCHWLLKQAFPRTGFFFLSFDSYVWLRRGYICVKINGVTLFSLKNPFCLLKCRIV